MIEFALSQFNYPITDLALVLVFEFVQLTLTLEDNINNLGNAQ